MVQENIMQTTNERHSLNFPPFVPGTQLNSVETVVSPCQYVGIYYLSARPSSATRVTSASLHMVRLNGLLAILCYCLLRFRQMCFYMCVCSADDSAAFCPNFPSVQPNQSIPWIVTGGGGGGGEKPKFPKTFCYFSLLRHIRQLTIGPVFCLVVNTTLSICCSCSCPRDMRESRGSSGIQSIAL